MQIDRNNYGAFFLDYAENNLDDTVREELARFLQHNQDLQDEFFEFENVRLNPDFRIVFEPKSKLKKLEIFPVGTINQENYEEWIIAFLEGDLSNDEMAVFNEFVSANLFVRQEIETFKKTYLKPKSSIIFPDKILLKRALIIPFRKRVLLYAATIAAIFVIAFGVFMLLDDVNQHPANQHVENIEAPNKTSTNPLFTDKEIQDKVYENQTAANKKNLNNTGIDESSSPENHEVIHQFENLSHSKNSVDRNADFTELNSLSAMDVKLQLAKTSTQNFNSEKREELSGIFDDMILREAINAELKNEENKKSAFGRVMANLGSKILNTGKTGQQEPALVNSIAARSKESFLEFADGLPIYRSIKKDDQNKTIFAVSENLSIGLSRQNNKTETAEPANR